MHAFIVNWDTAGGFSPSVCLGFRRFKAFKISNALLGQADGAENLTDH